jgi:predicted acetyltransferase
MCYRTAFLRMAYDYRQEPEPRYYRVAARAGFSFAEYVRELHRLAQGVGLPEHWVPTTTYWLVERCDVIYGVSRLRHILSLRSRKEGGHIGYDVPPSERGFGNATLLLRQTLEKARRIGILRALVTCDDDNRASARVIEKNGGRLEDRVVSDITGKVVRRYWIYT